MTIFKGVMNHSIGKNTFQMKEKRFVSITYIDSFYFFWSHHIGIGTK